MGPWREAEEAMGESSASAAVANPGLKESWTTAVV